MLFRQALAARRRLTSVPANSLGDTTQQPAAVETSTLRRKL